MIPETGELDWGDLERLVTARTKLVAIGAASNALGTITDVRRAGRARPRGGRLALRRCRALRAARAGRRGRARLRPAGVLGLQVLRAARRRAVRPPRRCSRRSTCRSCCPRPTTAPERLETGTQNHEGIVGAARAVDFLASLAGAGRAAGRACRRRFAALHARGQQLLEQLWNGLAAIPGVTLLRAAAGPAAHADACRSRSTGHDPGDVAAALAARGVFVSHGDFYATTVIERLGRAPAGLVRAGCACYTTRRRGRRGCVRQASSSRPRELVLPELSGSAFGAVSA